MSPVRWGPLGNDHGVIQPRNRECNCPPKQCHCMETIPEEEVAAHVIATYKKQVGVGVKG